MNKKRVAIVIGATGLVGANLVNELLSDDSFSKVKIFVRRSTNLKDLKLKEYVVDFDSIDSFHDQLIGDVLFSCMGTTIKAAKSKENQFRVDYTYQYEVAKAAKNNGLEKLVLVSSAGANSKSIFFYPKMKGQLEEAVTVLGFPSLALIQPSVLVGNRKESRFGEGFAIKMMDLFYSLGLFKKYRGIKGLEVAKAMVNISKKSNSGVSKFTLDELFKYVN